MSNPKKYPLSMSGDAFNAFKSDFDQMLRQLLMQMEEYESEEAVINMKMTVSLAQDQERDFEANGYDAMKDITKPTFKHDISTIMQIKNKKTGTLGGNMKLVWDKELHQYVMQEIDNGQTSMFDKKEEASAEQPEEQMDISAAGGELPPPPPQLPAAHDTEAIDVDYEVVEDGDGEEGKEDAPVGNGSSGTNTWEHQSPFEYMKQFIGAKMRVLERMGQCTVRTADNKVVLSSGFSVMDRFYCSPEKLKPHVGHNVVCVGYGQDEIVNISIECEDCNEVLFDVDAPKGEDIPNDYKYETPA